MKRAACLLPILFAACGGNAIDRACPDGGTAFTYENFGAPFLSTNCTRCHGSGVADRQGAPDNVTLDSHEQVQQYRERIYARAATDSPSMPPGPDKPPAAERDKLGEWLACGAP